MIDRTHDLSVTQQAQLRGLSRASVYYRPRAVLDADLIVMRAIDALHLERPFAGSRMLRDPLRLDGAVIGRDHVRTLELTRFSGHLTGSVRFRAEVSHEESTKQWWKA